jgi:copper(I)-binding protein
MVHTSLWRTSRCIMRPGQATGMLRMLLLALCGPAAAGNLGQAPPPMTLPQAWVRRPPPMAQVEQGSHGGSMGSPDTTAVYVTIQHHGHAPDALLAAASPIATTRA